MRKETVMNKDYEEPYWEDDPDVGAGGGWSPEVLAMLEKAKGKPEKGDADEK
jgi:hypothetical protein